MFNLSNDQLYHQQSENENLASKKISSSLHLPTFLIAFVLPIAQALLIFFHDAVNSFLPLPSLHPAMPPLFPLFLRFPAFLVDLDCPS